MRQTILYERLIPHSIHVCTTSVLNYHPFSASFRVKMKTIHHTKKKIFCRSCILYPIIYKFVKQNVENFYYISEKYGKYMGKNVYIRQEHESYPEQFSV